MNSQSGRPNRNPRKFSFGLGSLVLLVTLSAVCVAWWVDHNRVDHNKAPARGFDVAGPIKVVFSYRTTQDSSGFGRTIEGVIGMDFLDDQITLHTTNGGVVIPKNNLIKFEWFRE